ncbi:hypothetical protein Phi17:1_gp16 [Cellulophaga phage phi17:1]|uniref:Uncharacterized protein n=1 Tax=Cellulophaga phage phi17:1 TaxID=1327980 RepID=S0A1D9_9CAUD|nr:hypothetical protein Phi17:1_gp16 [Cellulophaga phage phi17:1]AGO48292.1 hypothetical protein Phi17:1_gp16 [Cellulophaga phage phi17:1]
MMYFNSQTPKRLIGSLIWNISENLKIPLGKYSPIIFGWMIGSKGVKK